MSKGFSKKYLDREILEIALILPAKASSAIKQKCKYYCLPFDQILMQYLDDN